ncbi:MAG: HIG1 domain-containing protein [Sphingomonadaceae bacterium]
METLLFILIVIAALATLYVLVRGVIAMAQGRDIGGVRSQSLMRRRVLYQAAAIVLVIVFLLLAAER